MRKNLYIAGPITGYPQKNFPAFDTAAQLARSQGWRVFSPADLDRAVGVHEDTNPLPEGFLEEVVLRDVACLFHVEAIALLPGWEASTGTRAELALAQWLRLDVYDAETLAPMDSDDLLRALCKFYGSQLYGDTVMADLIQ